MGSRTLPAALLTAVACALVLIEALQWGVSARFGPTLANSGACAARITSTDPTGKASGLRQGDVLRFDRMTARDRAAVAFHYARLHPAPVDSTIALSVDRDGRALSLAYRFGRDNGAPLFLAQLGFKIIILAIGLFVLWRGRDKAAAWLGIWCTGIAVALPDAWWGGLPPQARLFGSILTNLIWTLLPFGLYMVVESMVTRVRPAFVWIARTVMALSVLPSFIVDVLDATSQSVSGCALVALSETPVNVLFVGSQLIVLAYFIVGYSGTKGLERLRLRWVFWAFVLSRIGVMLNLVNRLAPHPLQLSGIEWLTIVLFPLGCAYAILRHRLIDVNFVLNRTLIYTILTTMVVGVFVLMEHVLDSVAVGRGVGLIMEVVVALGIGLSFNALHKRVERALDRTLFRAKYEAANKLQLLSEEAAYMENPDALLARASTEIPHAMGAAGAAVYERRDGYYHLMCNSGIHALPDRIEPDDPAFVRLRARLSQVDLADVNSAVGNDAVAFALSVRGQLTGAFICGRRKNGETYAPDELATLRSVVHEVGAELSAMRSRERAELLANLMSGKIDVASARTES